MNDVARLQIAGRSGHRVARRQDAALLADFATFGQKLRACSPVNGTIHATSPEQGRVGSIHDGISGLVCNITHNQLEHRMAADPIAHIRGHGLLVCERLYPWQFLAFQEFQRSSAASGDVSDLVRKTGLMNCSD